MNYIIDKGGLIQPENDYIYKSIMQERKDNFMEEKYKTLEKEMSKLKELLKEMLEGKNNDTD